MKRRIAGKAGAAVLVCYLWLCMVPLLALAQEAAQTVAGATLYQISEGSILEYNVTHSAPLSGDAVISGEVTSVEALMAAMGTIDSPATVLGTDSSGRTIGAAVTADLGLDAEGSIVSIAVTGISERPVIGISWKKDEIGKDYQGFAEAFERNGALAVFLPQVTDAQSAAAVLADVDGIFMTGGEDWNPALYDEEAYVHGSSGWNDARDTSDLNLMQQAIALDVPMLAVCRGEQGFNVAMGGGLIQDVPTWLGQKVMAGEIDASRATLLEDKGIGSWSQDANGEWKVTYTPCLPTHYRVTVDGLVHSGGEGYHLLAAGGEGIGISTESKWLYDIVGAQSIELVATAHHQAVNPERLGEGLTIVATSSDSVVEAIEHQDSLFALALQWHPERDALCDSRGIDVD